MAAIETIESWTVHPSMSGLDITDGERPRLWPQTMLYRFYDARADLLYVGVTGQPHERFTAHRRKAVWWPLIAFIEMEWLASMDAALEAERQAIRLERPAFNKRSAVVS